MKSLDPVPSITDASVKSLDKRLDALIASRETIDDAKKSNDKDIKLEQHFNYVSSLIELISVDFVKQLVFGLICVTIASLIPIILNTPL